MAHEDFMTDEWITDEMEERYEIMKNRILMHSQNLIGKLNMTNPRCWAVNWYDIPEVRVTLEKYGDDIHKAIGYLFLNGEGETHLKNITEMEQQLQRDQDATIEAMLTWEKQNNQAV